ncbi:hypothetical protein CTRG_04427 [Candida tropicalis MYA-3404]|uniref:Altered inheritance of mitochondria protein 9, mitochondrial n=1 Tax=Candida tropicalis (strain ATCC MYA-3404 / T1) TaxID=294747 RepID=AIM9_CANTT|nr:hypothetical protein CTRG_04427 [Candida tropicalis MYA-3404]C5MED4.1 RecName: Full=Altered inheritance of mitochondria protein 9, mitochondrial; AltName: Full=Found in mitochondrial proteome protein 29; Flags: Precursor [Candida tropicalis MYA-3404]EER31644.1 hypothetical protein CTRG_04427 [Candida tropicalis MYA-3404]KAG4405222.1 hypothetical protein JTP64_005258 [Candida tropicalis]
MLSRVARNSSLLKQLPKLRQTTVLPVVLKNSIRFHATSSENKEIFTKLTDSKDPQRNQFFQYTWGSWLKNDKLNKKKRETVFSIEGLTLFLDTIKGFETTLSQPKHLHGSFVLGQNKDLLGEAEDKIILRSIASIHEGKHHRIYKLTLNTGRDLVLRIPYKLDSDAAIAAKIKSEVATLDFLNLKLGLKVPRVLSYGSDVYNEVGSPYILEEFIPGDLLMRKWHPLSPDSEETNKALHEVIDPIAEFQDKLLSVTFNKFGSLYFHDDVEGSLQNDLPYDGETNEDLKNRWRIGPSVERQFSKNKEKLPQNLIDELNGPWDASNPIALMESVADIELENAKNKLALINADAGANENDKDLINKQIKTFEHLKKITPLLINTKSKSIMNVEELFKPRLYIPDLDPLNVIQQGKDVNYFIDFEGSTIKPFILTGYPKFVAYEGAKIYNLEEDIPGYNELDELEKEQYAFMYYKTRNERMWEFELNKHRHDLIAVASPHIKVIKSPYLQALDLKTDNDHLYVEGSIVQLQALWEAYVANELVNSKDSKFPIEYTAEYLDQHQQDLSDHQLETVSSPFSATGGWIPQDMFNTLKDQGIIVETEDGNYKIETEKVLENPPKPEEKN